VIDRLCAEHGDKRVALLQREHIIKLLAARSPGAANALRRSLRALMQHAVEIGMRADDPTRDVRRVPTAKSEGYNSWTESEIEQYEQHHPIGSRARLAFALLLYTGQQRSDVVRRAASTSATTRLPFAKSKPAAKYGFRYTRRWRRFSPRRPAP
jgi:site-specific recombinase XerD